MVQAHCVQTQARLTQAPRKRGVFLYLEFHRSKRGVPLFLFLGEIWGFQFHPQNRSQKGGTPFFLFHLEKCFCLSGRTRKRTRNRTRKRGGYPFFCFTWRNSRRISCGCERKGGTPIFQTAPGLRGRGYPIFMNSAWVLLSRKQEKDELRSKVF